MTSQPLNTLSFSDMGVIWHFLPLALLAYETKPLREWKE